MLKHHKLIAASCTIVAAAGAIAGCSTTAASSGPAAKPAASRAAAGAKPATETAAAGMEHFQLMSTTNGADTESMLATGLFTGGGIDRRGASADTLVFPGGTFKIEHSLSKTPQVLNTTTCLLTLNQRGTYKLLGGTGKFANISGHGTYGLTSQAVEVRKNGKCTDQAPLEAWQFVVKASGPAHM
jgi:hypothetical protein